MAVGTRGFPEPAREQRAEAAETREPDLHADVGHRKLTDGEELLGAFEPRLNAVLVRSDPEHCLELSNEVKGRYPHLARKFFDGRRRFVKLLQQLACPAHPTKPFVSQQHAEVAQNTRIGISAGAVSSRLSSSSTLQSVTDIPFISSAVQYSPT